MNRQMTQGTVANNVQVIPATKRRVSAGGQLKKAKDIRVAAYGRVSTDELAQQTSYEGQKSYYTKLINEKEGWTFAGMYADEAISGTNRNHRTEFNQMMQDALDGKIDYIITKSISRFARNTVDTLNCVRQLRPERKTRNELIYLLYEHTTEQVCKRLDQLEAEWGERFGQVFKTITVDNGSEFADWEGMQQSAADESEKRVTVFYCHPYCSFERGSNENQNRLVRRKIPKGENFDDRTEDDIQRVEDWINDYPREMFGWKTSGELFQKELARLA